LIVRSIRALQTFVFFAFYLLYASQAFAGAWNLEPGDGQIISTYNYSKASKAFTDIGDPVVEFEKNEGRIFFEHGLTKNFTIVTNAAHQTVVFNGLQSNINFSDFDDAELGLRYQIARREGLAVSLQGSYILGGGPPDSILDVGDAKDSFELRGLWGQSKEFENFVLFFDAQLAARARSTEKLEDWRSDLTLGFKRSEKLMLLTQIYHTERAAFGRDGFTVPKQSRTKVQGSVVFEIKKNRLVQLGYTETVAGRNIVKEKAITLGTWIRY